MTNFYCAQCGSWHPNTTAGCDYNVAQVVKAPVQIKWSEESDQIAHLASRLASLREAAQRAVQGWLTGDDVAGPMQALRAHLLDEGTP